MKKISTKLACAFLGSMLCGAFACITAGNHQNYARAEEHTYSGTNKSVPDGYATSGTSGTFQGTVVNNNDLTIGYDGINTKSSATAKTHAYGYLMFVKNCGVMYANNAITGYYPSSVSFTYSGGTGVSGKTLISFSNAKNATRGTGTETPAKSATYTLTNDDPTLTYWNFSTSGANVQIASFSVTYTKIENKTHKFEDITGPTEVGIGQKIQLSTTCELEDDVVFTSNNPSIATVTPQGQVTGVSSGVATIVATCNGNASTSIDINVTGAQHTITFEGPTTILVGQTAQIIPNCAAGCTEFAYEIDNEDRATVDENGYITGISAGGCCLTICCDEESIDVDLTIEIPVHTITFEGPTTIEVGQTVTITPHCGAGCGEFAFEIDNEDRATVTEDGQVTGISVGGCCLTICCDEEAIDIDLTIKEPNTRDYHEYNDYYISITDDQIEAGGQTLYDALRQLNTTKRTKMVGYNAMGTSVDSSKYVYTDYDLDYTTTDSKGNTVGTAIVGFYSGATINSTQKFTREHVWCASRLPGGRDGNTIDGDIHMTRPADMLANGDRSNKYFSQIEGAYTSDPGNMEPSYRGDCARILFYTLLLDPQLSLNDNPQSETSLYSLGNATELFRWNMEYPALQREVNRNNGGQYLQGNRNPFIDHPEWITAIWGKLYSSCTPLVAQYADGAYINISDTDCQVSTNSRKTLTATASKNAYVTWSSNNTAIATVSSDGVVTTGSQPGSAIITATAVINGETVKTTCRVVVGAPDSPIFKNATSEYDIQPGQPVVIASSVSDEAMSTTQNANNRGVTAINRFDNGYISWTGSDVCVFTLKKSSAGNWNFYDDALGYLYYSGTSNTIKSRKTYDNTCDFDISFEANGVAKVTSSNVSARSLQFNQGNTVFACYTSVQKAIQLFTCSDPYLGLSTRNVDGEQDETFEIFASTYNLGDNPTITWSIANSSVATISSTQGSSIVVSLKNLGNTIITVTAEYAHEFATQIVGVSCITNGVDDELTPLQLAISYANSFLDAFTCDSTGKTTPAFKNGSSWALLGAEFNALDSEVKAYFSTTADFADSSISDCVERYDYIISKYTTNVYGNFMGRSNINQVGQRSIQSGSEKALFVTGIVVMLFSFVSVAALFVVRKNEN